MHAMPCSNAARTVHEDVFRQKVAFEIQSTNYHSSFFGNFFGVTGSVVFTNGLKYFSVSKTFNIASYQVIYKDLIIITAKLTKYIYLGR